MQAAEPDLSQRPLVLTERDSRRGLVVAAANRLARAAGVRPAMRLAEATGLVELEAREHEPDEDIQTLCSLTEQAQQFSPLVGIEQLEARRWAGRWLHQPESLILDITGLGNLFGGDANLLSQAGGWLQQRGYFGCLAVGNTLGAAWALANYALRSQESVTTELSTLPNSRYLLLSPEQYEPQIARLPLAALRIEEATVSTLRKLGLSRIEQLANLPRAGLASRLGEQLLLRWDQATGVRTEPIVALGSSPDWQSQQELEFPTDRKDTLVELIRRAVIEVASRLDQRGEGALRMVCRLDLVDFPSVVLQVGLFRPTSDPAYINMLLSSMLDQQLSQSTQAPVWRLCVCATLTAPLVWRQGELFQTDQAANRHQVAGLIDMLSARLGRKSVLKARLQRESQPERAFTLRPMTGLRPDGEKKTLIRKLSSRSSLRTADPQREDPLRRPTQLIDPPLSVEVAGVWQPNQLRDVTTNSSNRRNLNGIDGTAISLAAAPARIKTANGWHEVIDACGPERLESGWWKGPSSRRDYYRIVTHQGSWWWIYRDLNNSLWYLHGLFD